MGMFKTEATVVTGKNASEKSDLYGPEVVVGSFQAELDEHDVFVVLTAGRQVVVPRLCPNNGGYYSHAT